MNSQNKNIKILAVSRKKPVLNGYIGDEFAMSSMNKRAAVRLLTGLILQEIKDDEYPNKSELELRRMFSYHPAGYLVEKYHVPKAGDMDRDINIVLLYIDLRDDVGSLRSDPGVSPDRGEYLCLDNSVSRSKTSRDRCWRDGSIRCWWSGDH